MKSRSRCVLVLTVLASLGWFQVASPAVGPYGGWINDLKEDSSGRILAATSFGGIYRSDDNAESWEQIYNGLLDFDPLSVAVNPSGHIFVGSEGFNVGNGIQRSTDDGVSWQILSNGLSNVGARDLLVMPSGEIFACTALPAGLYRSTNGGSTFTAVSTLPAQNTTDIEANSSGALFVGTRFETNRMYRSTDNGATWQLASSGLTGDVNDIFIDASNTLYAATSTGVYTSTNNGANWTSLNAPGPVDYRGVVVVPGGVIYAAFDPGILGGSVYRSTDGGATWTQDSGLPEKAVGKLLYTSGGSLFAGGFGLGVYRRVSTMLSSGTDWEWKNNGLANTFVTSIADDANTGTVYAGTRHSRVFRSLDGGLTWESAASGIPESEWIYDAAVSIDGTVFASGASNGIYRSTDQGNTWTNIFAVAATALGCNGQGHVFAGLGSRVYRSTNNGASWTNAILTSVQNIADIAFDGTTVYVATGTPFGFGQGVYRSTDNGLTWAAFNAGLTNLNVTCVAVGPEEPPALGKGGVPCRVECGTDGSGLFGLDEPSQTWWSNPLLPDGNVVDLENRVRGLVARLYDWANGDPADCTIDEFRAAQAELETIGAILNSRGPAKSVEPIVLIGTNGAGILREVLSPTDVGHTAAAPVAFQVAAPYPNPFRDASTLSFALPEAGPVRVDVFDVSGRMVRTLTDGAMTRGAHTVVWDGRNAAGREVGAGVYFYRLTAASETSMRRTVLAR